MTRKMDMDGQIEPQTSSGSFMEPRTIPKNWDVSAFDSTVPSSTGSPVKSSGEAETPAAAESYDGDGMNTALDPFPQPRTVPGNWDVSDLI